MLKTQRIAEVSHNPKVQDKLENVISSIEPEVNSILSELGEGVEIKVLVKDTNSQNGNKFMEIFNHDVAYTEPVKKIE